jgi:hypothetical protein
LNATPLVQALWLALPTACAAVAHMIVVRRGLFPGLARPLDGGLTLRGHRLFGANKTWRGVAFMPVAAAAFGAAVGGLWGGEVARSGYAPLDYLHILEIPGPDGVRRALGHLVVNLALGAAYVAGELPNSFVKRQLGIAPGSRGHGRALEALLLVGDQLDSVLAALGLAMLAFSLDWRVASWGIAVLPGVHFVVTLALRRLRIKKAL